MLPRTWSGQLLTLLLLVTAAGEAAAQDCPQPVGHFGGGPARAVAADGGRAYVGAGVVLQVVDLSTPTAPTLLGEVSLLDLVDDLAVSGDHVYVADGLSGLRVVDVSNPAAPVEVGALPSGPVVGVAVSGSHAFLATSGGLVVVDVSTPSAPAEVGTCDTCGGWSITVAGSLALVSGSTVMKVVDIADPTAPFELGRYDLPYYPWPWPVQCYAGTVAVAGTVAYLSCSNGGWYSIGELHVLDISDPTTPTSVAVVGECYGRGGPALALAGSVLYVGSMCGIRALDVSDPLATVELGFHWAREVEDTGTADIALSGGHLLLANETAGLDVMTGCHLFVDGFEIGTTATWGSTTPSAR